MAKEIKKTLQIRKIKDTNERKVQTKGDVVKKHTHRIECIDRDGSTKLTITMPEPIIGFNEKDVIDITITTSQTTLDDFSGWKEKAGKKEKKE